MFKLFVLCVVLAVARASPSGIWGAGLGTPLATPLAASWGASWGAPLAAPIATPHAVPIATVSVATPGHWIKKRSVVATPWPGTPVAAPVTWGRTAGWIAPAPAAVVAPVAPWGLGLGARVGGLW